MATMIGIHAIDLTPMTRTIVAILTSLSATKRNGVRSCSPAIHSERQQEFKDLKSFKKALKTAKG